MDLSLTDRQETLKTTAREFFERECPTTLVRAMEGDSRGYTTDLWEGMADLGWMGLPFPADYGGSNGSLTDLAVLLEEFGRALVPGPFFNSVAVVGLTILDAGSERQRVDLLPRIADGSLIATAALLESDARYGAGSVKLSAERRGDGLALIGTKMFVEYADSADLLLVPARSDDGEISLLLVPRSAEGIDTTPLESISRDPQYAVQFDNVLVDDGAALGGGVATMKRLLDRATVLHCAQSVGGAQQVLEMTIAYTKQRVQFDRAIATFQSVQHHCADMVMAIDAARLATYEAITRIEDGQTADKEIALAKALTNHAYKWTTLTAQQIHGGIGFMEEYDLQLWTRRAKVAELKFGASSGHVEAFARQMGLA
jgi:alkylation response protein AidB-like acyl-CoA dehydrogenase